jgi:hypothetical protein
MGTGVALRMFKTAALGILPTIARQHAEFAALRT